MSPIYASISGATGRLRRRNSKPLAWGVKRTSLLKSGRYRVRLADHMPSSGYAVLVKFDESAQYGGAVVDPIRTNHFDVTVYAKDGTIMKPTTLSVLVFQPPG